MSSTYYYCGVLLFTLYSSYVPYVASFSGLFIFNCSLVFCSVHIPSGPLVQLMRYTMAPPYKHVTNKHQWKRRRNQEWTIQKHWLHWAHKTQDKQTKNTTQHNTENEKDEQHGPHLKTGVTNLCLYKHFGVGLLLITRNYLLSKQNEDLWYYSFVMHGNFLIFFIRMWLKY